MAVSRAQAEEAARRAKWRAEHPDEEEEEEWDPDAGGNPKKKSIPKAKPGPGGDPEAAACREATPDPDAPPDDPDAVDETFALEGGSSEDDLQ